MLGDTATIAIAYTFGRSEFKLTSLNLASNKLTDKAGVKIA